MKAFESVSELGMFGETHADYQPPEFPLIASAGIREAEVDHETNGLRWFGGHRPIGTAVCYPSDDPRGYTTRYLPIRHRVGPNLDLETYRRWFTTEFKGVTITNLNTRFDAHMSREDGCDWEALGCKVSDVAHSAALLDDHRQHFSLESLARDFLPEEERKVRAVNGIVLDTRRMAEYHPAIIAVRAEADVRQVHLLKQVFQPMLEKDDLLRVKALEDSVIFPVCEMEKNGAHIDIEKLNVWLAQCQKDLEEAQLALAKLIGRRTQASLFEGGKAASDYLNPNSPNEMEQLFRSLGLPVARTEPTAANPNGRPSFTSTILKSIDHPVIKQVLRISKLQDLLSKYLIPYSKTVDRSTGILRYALHQLRAQKDPHDDFSSAGTVSGRFSSTKIVEDDEGDVGLNIQQIMKPEKQIAAYGDQFIIRELHIPLPGYEGLSSDAMQIEYRAFAAYTSAKRLIDVYKKNPLVSYHKMLHRMLKPFVSLSYKGQKDLNFAKQYGAGLRKMAIMMGEITAEEYRELLAIDDHRGWMKDPRMATTININNIYNQQVPEAKTLLARAKELAEKRGYVMTITGRRSRFPDGKRSHKALNAIIQGTAADVMKQKLVELHAARFETGFILRFTVHDEVDGDIPSAEAAQMVSRILNRQSFDISVPILWETNIGPNWYQLTKTFCPLCQRLKPEGESGETCSCIESREVA